MAQWACIFVGALRACVFRGRVIIWLSCGGASFAKSHLTRVCLRIRLAVHTFELVFKTDAAGAR